MRRLEREGAALSSRRVKRMDGSLYRAALKLLEPWPRALASAGIHRAGPRKWSEAEIEQGLCEGAGCGAAVSRKLEEGIGGGSTPRMLR